LGNALDQETVLARALGNYAANRRWHVRGFQLASLLLTPFYQSDSRALAWVRDFTFDTISRLPGCRRIVAGLISGMLGDPLGKIGPEPSADLAVKRD
jgi:2-polyprenyl-6-methoxyphenol hydroxylase-like FAD-dependent oxidoreductase